MKRKKFGTIEKVRRFNYIAAGLRSPKYRRRIVRSRKVYSRKHTTPSPNDF